jgi:CubicO group peptidase (beta-lactamase class C family)
LNENGAPIVTLEWNWAKEPQDGGEGWTPDTRQHVASLSKQPTAIAMTRLLNEKGIYPDTTIIDYLPDYWVKGPNVDQITFARLMTHTSGLNYGATSGPSDFEFMKEQIAAGTTHLGEFWYQNMNFELCRILISTINGNILPSAVWSGLLSVVNDTLWDVATLSAYQAYVHANVFEPSGVTDPTLAHETDDALAYNFPVSGNGWNSGDLTTMAGGTGWHMTVDDVLNVMGTFRRAGTIMSAAQAQTMLENSFGIDWITQTQLGTFYAKVGGWGGPNSSRACCSTCRRTWSWRCWSTLPSARRRQSPVHGRLRRVHEQHRPRPPRQSLAAAPRSAAAERPTAPLSDPASPRRLWDRELGELAATMKHAPFGIVASS